jgi:hypothetical protein
MTTKMKSHSKSGKQWRVVLRGVDSMEGEFEADILGHTLRIKQEVKHDGTLICVLRLPVLCWQRILITPTLRQVLISPCVTTCELPLPST